MIRGVRLLLMAMLGLLADARTADADWLFSVFAGGAAGSHGYFSADDGASGIKPVAGVSVTRAGRRFSFDAEAALLPGFFTREPDGLVTSSRVIHVSGNLIVNLPSRGRFHPYALAGGGTVHVHARDAADVFPVSEWLGAVSVGGGVFVPISGRLRFRLDARYTRSRRREGAESPIRFGTTFVDYGRVTAGLAFAVR